MEHDTQEVLSAFADGESLETPRLLDALTQPGAHEALVDFIRLRGALEGAARDPRPEFVRRMRAKLDPAQRPWWRKAVRVPAPALAAALALFLVAFLLLEALDLTRPDREPADAPPAPDRVLYFEEGVDWTAPSPREARLTLDPTHPFQGSTRWIQEVSHVSNQVAALRSVVDCAVVRDRLDRGPGPRRTVG